MVLGQETGVSKTGPGPHPLGAQSSREKQTAVTVSLTKHEKYNQARATVKVTPCASVVGGRWQAGTSPWSNEGRARVPRGWERVPESRRACCQTP